MKNKCHKGGGGNNVRKGEIARNKQFLLFSQCFPQLYIYVVRQNAAKCGDGLKHLGETGKNASHQTCQTGIVSF